MHQRHTDGNMRLIACAEIDGTLHRFDVALPAVRIPTAVLFDHTDEECLRSMFLSNGGSNGEENPVAKRHIRHRNPRLDPLGRNVNRRISQCRSTNLSKERQVDFVPFHGPNIFGDETKGFPFTIFRTLPVIEVDGNHLIPLLGSQGGRQRAVHPSGNNANSFFHPFSLKPLYWGVIFGAILPDFG